MTNGGRTAAHSQPHMVHAQATATSRCSTGALWISTDLYPDSDAKAPAQAICRAASAYQITEIGEFTGVTVRAVDGERLVLRMDLSDKC